MNELKSLPTEQRNPDTINIDELDTLDMLKLINNEDKKVAFCVEKHLDKIAKAVDAVSERFAAGGRIIYCGAGTSGRMGFMDSAECPPTFGIDNDRVVSLIAGGSDAMLTAKEGAEDSPELCVEDLKAINFSKADVLVGIAASGRTPYVEGGLKYAKLLGAVTVSVTCNESEDCVINQLADYPIGIYAGPEAITGSTRMKAGTVQKMTLNMFSTSVMIKTGKVYSNLMVNVKTSNEKLVDRAKRIVKEITGVDDERISDAMLKTGNDTKLAIIMLLTDSTAEEADKLLKESNGHVKNAIKSIQNKG